MLCVVLDIGPEQLQGQAICGLITTFGVEKLLLKGYQPCLPNFKIVQLSDCVPGLLFAGECDKSISSVVPVEVHHHPHFIDSTNLGKKAKHTFPSACLLEQETPTAQSPPGQSSVVL